MREEPLTTNENHPIIRAGDNVRRSTEFWSPAVHHLLGYLKSVNFAYSPEFVGIDDEGREVLSFFSGESGADSWKHITGDEGLRSYAKLLRAYHDAVSGYEPPPELEWATGQKGLKTGQIICHGDFGPWNIVWKDGKPVGIVDWDLAHPNTPQYDVLYALEYAAPFRSDEIAMKWHGFDTPPNRKRRIDVFLEAYGSPPIVGLTAKITQMQREVGKLVEYLAKRNIQPQNEWAANGVLAEIEARAIWTEQNASIL
jgi:hypothetical protein